MIDDSVDEVEFDALIALALARGVDAGESPRPDVKQRLMSSLGEAAAVLAPGFSFVWRAIKTGCRIQCRESG